jgi:amino acid adenylation domain-containing protein
MGNTARYNSNEAVKAPDGAYSYEELNRASNQTANLLMELGIKQGVCVGIYLEKCLEAVVAIFGILKTGAVYVPLDPTNRIQHNIHIVNECGIDTVLTTTSHLDDIPRIMGCNGRIVLMNHRQRTHKHLDGAGIIFAYDHITRQSIELSTPVHFSSDNPATIFYTSGSTGDPKGVMISHGGISAFIQWALAEFRVGSKDRFISHAPLHFDISLLDIFVALSAGATVVLVPTAKVGNAQYMIDLISKESITFWQSVPSILVLMLEYGKWKGLHLNHVKHVIFTGERMPVKYLKPLMGHMPEASFYNVYGCTETNDTFIYRVPDQIHAIPDPLPIGTALPYVDFRIVDPNEQDVSPGTQGELLVSAPTLMCGYQKNSGRPRRSDQMEELEIPDGRRVRYYRTRDLVVQQPDGSVMLHGRLDDIIKTSGYRVNLLEVRSTVQSYPDVVETAVFAVEDQFIGKKIITVVAVDPDVKLKPLNLRLFCAARLPKYAIPVFFDIRDTSLPKTSSGKVDKRALEAAYRQSTASHDSSRSKRPEVTEQST